MPTHLPLFAQGLDPTVVGFVVSLIIVWTIGLAVASLIGGFLLRAATRLICNIDLTYGTAVGYVFVVSFVCADFGVITKVLFDMAGATTTNDFGRPTIVVQLVSNVLAFLFASVFFGSMITDFRKRPIGFGNGALISVALSIVVVIVAILLTALAFAFATAIGQQT